MKPVFASSLAALLLGAAPASAQPAVEAHAAAAREAAGSDFQGVYASTCGRTFAPPAAPAAPRPGPPERSVWYAPPGQAFDNLYWIGTKEHSAWALTTSQGIIIIDTLYNYAVESQMVEGLKTLGLNPADVKYVIVSHGHGDHDQGARLFQERYGARVVMGAADWDVVTARTNMPGGAPVRDIAVTGPMTVTLGDTTVSVFPTPGHTLGTLSFTFPVRDRGRALTAAYSGGTAFNFPHSADRFDTYAASQQMMAKAAADAGATVMLSNHSAFDKAADKAPGALGPRAAGAANPFELGAPAVQRYFKVLEQCALATRVKGFGR